MFNTVCTQNRVEIGDLKSIFNTTAKTISFKQFKNILVKHCFEWYVAMVVDLKSALILKGFKYFSLNFSIAKRRPVYPPDET